MSYKNDSEVLRIARRNKWTLCYLTAISTAMLLMTMYDVWSHHA